MQKVFAIAGPVVIVLVRATRCVDAEHASGTRAELAPSGANAGALWSRPRDAKGVIGKLSFAFQRCRYHPAVERGRVGEDGKESRRGADGPCEVLMDLDRYASQDDEPQLLHCKT